MPSKPLQPCRQPGCAALAPSGYCAAHARSDARRVYDQTKRKADPALALAARIRNTAQWQKVRALHRQLSPLCCDPFGEHNGMPFPNQTSHHILPLATHPHLAYHLANLAPLCTACHARVERIERNGDSTAALFTARVTEGGN